VPDRPGLLGWKEAKTVPSWHRWLNFWRLRHAYDEGVAIEFYRSRKGVTVTRVVRWSELGEQ
jgi:hypothetical protein